MPDRHTLFPRTGWGLLPLLVGYCIVIGAMGFSPSTHARLTVTVVPAAPQADTDLTGAVIYLTPTAPSPEAPQVHATGKPADGKRLEVAQQGRLFSPYISVVQSGSEVRFPNRDSIAHHVYSFSSTRPFELPLYKGKLAPSITFDKPGVVTLGCNIHDWMLGYILVLDTPYFEQLQGLEATFDSVPAGEYSLHFWTPGLAGSEAQPVPVKISGDPQSVQLPLQRSLSIRHQPQPPEGNFDELEDY